MPVTPEDLQAGFQSLVLAGTLHAANLEEALADPHAGRLVKLHAMLHSRGIDPYAPVRVKRRPSVIAPEPPHPAEQSARADLFDPKRLAAGDRDD